MVDIVIQISTICKGQVQAAQPYRECDFLGSNP